MIQIKEKILHFIPPYRQFVTFSKLGNYGRFGNQLFQYAAVRAYSIINNLPLILPSADNHELSKLRIEVEYVSINNLEKVKKHYYKEEYFHFNPDFVSYHNRIDFNGFFQSYRYFSEFRDILTKELKLKDHQIIHYCNKYIKEIKDSNPGRPLVSLHNRRGDYVSTPNKFSDKKLGVSRPDMENFHPLLTMEYINQSKSIFPEAVFLIFSDNQDDINWCKKNINGLRHYYSEGHDKYIDFTLMQLCDHNIISNSSFSWWSAWLNKNQDKIVVAPQKWFGKEYIHYNMNDLFPEGWMVI